MIHCSYLLGVTESQKKNCGWKKEVIMLKIIELHGLIFKIILMLLHRKRKMKSLGIFGYDCYEIIFIKLIIILLD